MRCSLLVLSSYVDSELDRERTGELEAHLIGCTRCSTALGYLREETERIATLAPVRVGPHEAHELFSLIGLEDPDDDHPGLGGGGGVAAPVRHAAAPVSAVAAVRHLHAHPYDEHASDSETLAPPVDYSAIAGAATSSPPLPPPAWDDEPAPERDDVIPVATPPYAGVPPDDTDDPRLAAFAFEPEPLHHPGADAPPPVEHEPVLPAPIAPPEPAPLPPPHEEEWAPAATVSAEPGLEPPDVEVPGIAAPLPVHEPAGPPQQVPGGSSLLHRMRDSVAVRLALMRGGGDSDSVQIVSGAGAPQWEGRPAHRGYQQRMERERGIAAQAVGARAAAQVEIDDVPPIAVDDPAGEEHQEATGYAVPAARQAPIEAEPVADDVPEPVVAPAAEPPIAEVPPVAEAEPAAIPQAPGRHMRSVARSQGAATGGFGGLGQLTSAVARRTGARNRHVAALEHVDRRVWIVGAAVVVLLLIGLLTGKNVTPIVSPIVTAPHASAAPTAAPTLAPSAAATPAPTAAPTPAPTPASTGPALIAPVTAGSGGSGYTVDDLRFGIHGATYRVVFDLSGGSGDPTVVVGYAGSATVLYVEFSGNTTAGAPNEPSGKNLLTSVQLMPASTDPGKTVYQLTLKHHAAVSAYYVAGPRFVLDLT